MSTKKDSTSEEKNYYAFMKFIYNKTYSKPNTNKEVFTDNSSYIHKKKSIAIGKVKSTSMFTLDNKREIVQAKRRLRSRG